MTLDEQIKCVGRETGLRKAVYPRFVASKKLTQEKADYELAAMEEVYKTLKALKADSGAKVAPNAAPQEVPESRMVHSLPKGGPTPAAAAPEARAKLSAPQQTEQPDHSELVERLHELYRRMGRDEDSIIGVRDMKVVLDAASALSRTGAAGAVSDGKVEA